MSKNRCQRVHSVYLSIPILIGMAFSESGWSRSTPLGDKKVRIVLDAPLYVNSPNTKSTLPRNWRTTQSREGLSNLQISGSGEFSVEELQGLISMPGNENLLVVDLRQESHGFVNGKAVSWFVGRDTLNAGKSLTEIEADEHQRLQDLKKAKISKVLGKKWTAVGNPKNTSAEAELKIDPSTVMSEKELLKKFNIDYLRIPSPDHQRPSDEGVDQLIQIYQKTKEGGVKNGRRIHFHCAAGKGRTTTFMVLYDMLENCSKVNLEDILTRQKDLGGADLRVTSHPDEVREGWAKERVAFLNRFYAYCKSQRPDFKMSWSGWKASQESSIGEKKK